MFSFLKKYVCKCTATTPGEKVGVNRRPGGLDYFTDRIDQNILDAKQVVEREKKIRELFDRLAIERKQLLNAQEWQQVDCEVVIAAIPLRSGGYISIRDTWVTLSQGKAKDSQDILDKAISVTYSKISWLERQLRELGVSL